MQFKLIFYVPESHLEIVKHALFAVGAGKLGDYDSTCWQCLGQGQFRSLPGAHPTIGSVGQLTCVPEFKVEMLCDALVIEEAIKQLKKHHPYEEPGYDVIRLEAF